MEDKIHQNHKFLLDMAATYDNLKHDPEGIQSLLPLYLQESYLKNSFLAIVEENDPSIQAKARLLLIHLCNENESILLKFKSLVNEEKSKQAKKIGEEILKQISSKVVNSEIDVVSASESKQENQSSFWKKGLKKSGSEKFISKGRSDNTSNQSTNRMNTKGRTWVFSKPNPK